jgi:predicted TIM-barrel fold metal-dependent hydrolase
MIDAHSHFLPPSYRSALAAAGIERPDGFPYVPDWSAAGAVSVMDDLGVEFSLISISSPGLAFAPAGAQSRLAQSVNEEGAEVVRDRPDRFGLLASLSLIDLDTALAEVARCRSELGVTGFTLLTNYNGAYLSSANAEPLFAELDRVAALVSIHPASPSGWEVTSIGRPRPMIEFPFDTTRVVFNLLLDGVFRRYPSIRWVIPHVGSALPALADRVQEFANTFLNGTGDPVDVVGELSALHHDLTGPTLPHALPGLIRLVGTSKLLYGSDLPFAPVPLAQRSVEELRTTDALNDEERAAMFSGSAHRLLARA